MIPEWNSCFRLCGGTNVCSLGTVWLAKCLCQKSHRPAASDRLEGGNAGEKQSGQTENASTSGRPGVGVRTAVDVLSRRVLAPTEVFLLIL